MTQMVMQQNKQNRKSTDSWWRTQSATMALLKHAYQKIDDAEEELARQEERIQKLEKLASTDELTGLYNRRGFTTEFERDMNRMKRHGSEGGLFILFDLNKFKEINDTHGHLAGDKCLQLVGRTLLKLIRNTDTTARLGGDEFVLFLPDISPDKAYKTAEKIRKALNALSLQWKGHNIQIQTSMGVKYCTTDTDFDDVYDDADASLYADKELSKDKH